MKAYTAAMVVQASHSGRSTLVDSRHSRWIVNWDGPGAACWMTKRKIPDTSAEN
jgi:hypothetical protein